MSEIAQEEPSSQTASPASTVNDQIELLRKEVQELKTYNKTQEAIQKEREKFSKERFAWIGIVVALIVAIVYLIH